MPKLIKSELYKWQQYNVYNLNIKVPYSSSLVIQYSVLVEMLLLQTVPYSVESTVEDMREEFPAYYQDNPLAGQLAWQQAEKEASQVDHILEATLAFLEPAKYMQ